MTKLVETIEKLISNIVQTYIKARPDSEVRMVLRGLPIFLLDKLFENYSHSEGVQIPDHDPIRVLFVTNDSKYDSSLICARCLSEDVVSSRNVRQTILILLPVDNHLNLSTESSVSFIGLTPDTMGRRQRFAVDPFVRTILNEFKDLYTIDDLNWEQISNVISFTLDDWGNHGDSERTKTPLDENWNLLDNLFEVGNETNLLLARCGLPNVTNGEMGTQEHLQILEVLAKFIEDNGFNGAKKILLSEAEENYYLYINDFFNFLFSKKCESPPDFTKSPAFFYSQDSVPADWWNALDLDIWTSLLQSVKPPKEEGIKVECINSIITHLMKGLPWVFQDYPIMKVNIERESQQNTISIYSGKGKNPKLEAEISNHENWTPEEVPIHSNMIHYKFNAGDGYKPANIRIISLENYEPGVIVFCNSAKKITPPKKKDSKAKNIAPVWECDLELPTTGTFLIELMLSSHTIIANEAVSIDTTSENVEHKAEISQDNTFRRLFYAETDEQSTYLVKVEDSRLGQYDLHIHFHANDENPAGVNSVFEALVMDNVRGKSTASSVEIHWSQHIFDLERKILEDPLACFPLIISGDYLSKLTNNLNWEERPILSSYSCENDVRPDFKNWNVPKQFIQVRKKLLNYLTDKMSQDEKLLELFRFDQHMREAKFKNLVMEYLQVYLDWLKSDYESAILSDAYMVIAPEGNTTGLSSEPEAILMTPLHPVRFAWHCLAQSVLAETAYEKTRCPAAGIINPHSVPDIIHVPCIQPGGKSDLISFVAIRSSSPYWGVFWNGGKMSDLNDSPKSGLWGDDFGISISSVSNGFNKAQVKRAINDVRDIRIAKSMVQISLVSDTLGASSCNEGIIEWCQDNLGNVEKDDWAPAGARRLDILDMRTKGLHPSSAVIADLTDKTNAKIRWWFSQENTVKNDLCIIENLGEHLPRMNYGRVRSPIGLGGLFRSRVRRHIESSQGSKFIQESRVGKYYNQPGDKSDLPDQIGLILSIMEDISLSTSKEEVPNSFVFTPRLETIMKSFNQSVYCALSSSSIDSSFFFGKHGNAFLWDYNLPNYSNISGENNGFYLLVRENPTLISSIHAAIEKFEIPSSTDITDADIKNVIVEISRRGMPTLKRISEGGTAAVGEFGVLIALRLLQDSFITGKKNGCIIPVKETMDDGFIVVNLIVPMDPFQLQLDSLRRASEGTGGTYRRPDLIVFSIALDNLDKPISIKITPIEIKARTSELSKEEMLSAIEQTKSFSKYIKKLLFPKEGESLGCLWGLTIKDFLSSLLSFGFRVYGILDECGNDDEEWSLLHEKVIGGLLADELSIDIDDVGRLIVIDKSVLSRSFDADGDAFDEVIILTAADALEIFKNNSTTLISSIRTKVDNWKLCAQSDGMQFGEEASNDGSDKQSDSIPKDVEEFPFEEKDKDKREREPDGKDNSEFTNGVDSNLIEEGIKFKVGDTLNGFSKYDRYFWPSNTNLNQINIGIVGDLGTGKTQLTKALIYQMVTQSSMNRGHRPRFLIFDYKNDYTSLDFVEAVGAKVVEPFELPLNMFDVSSCSSRKPWIERHKFFTDVLSKIYGGIGQVQQLNIKNAVRRAYESAMSEGDSAPIINQVYEEYLSVTNGKPDSPTNILSDLIDMEIFQTDKSKIIPFEEFMDGVVVIKLSSLGQDDNTKNLIVVIFLNFFYEYMLKLEKKPFLGKDPTLRFINSMLLVDEADSIMKYEFDVLRKILLQGREFGVGVLLASQYLSHFRKQETNYLEPLLTWFIHKVPNITVKELESIGLTRANNEMITQIRSLQPHECLFKTLDVNGDFILAKPFYKLISKK